MPDITSSLLLMISALIVGLTAKSCSSRVSLYCIALFVYILFIAAQRHPDEDVTLRYQAGMSGAIILGAFLDFLVLQPNPQEKVRYNKQTTPASRLSFFPRLKWAFGVFANTRGVNMTNSIRGLRFPEQKTRWGFVLYQLMWAGLYYVVADVVGAITRRNPAMHYPPTETLSERGVILQAANVLLFWLALLSLQDRMYTFLSAITVALGVSNPEDWPAFFGVWSGTKSIRTFWGRTWHQSIRRSVQPQSKFLSQRVINLSPGSLSAKYLEIYVSFFLSGIYHAMGDWVVQRNPSTALVNIEFFLLQAVVITLEDFLTFLGKKVGMSNVPSIVTYIWVIGWMTITSTPWVESVVDGGSFSIAPAFSIVELGLSWLGL